MPSIPVSACTIVSDPSCTEVRAVTCDEIPPSSVCEVHLRRKFAEPGTYCVNITLEDSSSMALTSTTVTINKSQDAPGRSILSIYACSECLACRKMTSHLCSCSVQRLQCRSGALLSCCAHGGLCIYRLSNASVSNLDLFSFFLNCPEPTYPHFPLFSRRYKVYRPIRGPLLDSMCCSGVKGRVVHLRETLFPSREESHHLLTERRPA